MKKFSILFSILVVMIVLVGCGNSLTKEEVVNKAFEAEVNSMYAESEVELSIYVNGQNMNQTISMEGTYVFEPFFAHIKVANIDGILEMYFDDETIYVAESSNQWIKTETSVFPELVELANDSTYENELNRLEKFWELFEYEKIEDNHVLSLNVSEESSENENEIKLIKDLLAESDESFADEEIIVNEFDYKITLDENFYLHHVIATMDIDIIDEGEAVTYKAVVEAEYSQVNSVENDSVPNEVINNATEL